MSTNVEIARTLLTLLFLASAQAADCPSDGARSPAAQEKFRELDRRAQIEFRRGQFNAAYEAFRQAACLAPEMMHSYYALYESATQAMVLGDFVAARSHLSEADRLQPAYPAALAMLVKVDLASADLLQLKTTLSDLALRFPTDGRLHAELSQDLLHDKKYDLALAEAFRAQRVGGADAKTAINLAVLENQLGAFADAARVATGVEEQSALVPSVRASAAAIAGLSFERLGQTQEAVQHLHSAMLLAPDREQPFLSLARIYTEAHEDSKALEILEQARAATGGSSKLLLQLGSVLLSLQRYQPASQVLAELIQQAPDEFEAYLRLAEAYRNLGGPSQATATLRQLEQRKRDGDPLLHIVIARSLLAEETVDYSAVLQELALAEPTASDKYDIYLLRGKVFLATGVLDQAVTSLQRAISLRPTEQTAYYQLGMVYRKLGKPELAKRQFEFLTYLKGAPESPAP